MQTRLSPSLTQLHSLARQANIPEFDKLSKTILYHKLKDQYNLDRLQRLEARAKSGKRSRQEFDEDDNRTDTRMSKSSKKNVRKQRSSNRIDPIMFVPLGKHVYTFTRPNGTSTTFNLDSLIDYMLITGDFQDPETRIPFCDSDLKEIDGLAKSAGLSKESVFHARHDMKRYTDAKFVRDALLGLERCAGEIVADILTIIEEYDPDEGQMRLFLSELPAFADLYKQIKEADSIYAKQCMKHWKLFLQGPPNRPTEDVYGLLKVVLMFLRECD